MIKFIIAYDNQDAQLGAYFTLCKDNLIAFLNEKAVLNIVEIGTQHCTQLNIELKINAINNDEKLLFVAYSHGSKDAVICGGEAYVKVNENTHLFNNSIFYSNACLCGRDLKTDLIQKGCSAFIGSKNEVSVLLLDPNLSAKLDNYALLIFIENNQTIHEAYISMLNHYDYEIDRLNEFEKGIGFGKAAYLLDARDSLVFEGEKNLKFENL